MPPRQKLVLAPGFTLPLDAVTETYGWVGNRGSGKTFGAKVAAEEMLKAGDQIAVLDPVDAWWGLRYGKTTQQAGLPVYVFGGVHGDLPLEATAGALMADVVVERGISAVFSLRHLTKAKQRTFAKDFAQQLYLRKGEAEYRTAMHVFIEEAHTFAPQGQLRGEDYGCLGAIQDLVLQGRGSGIGVSLITQRVAALSRSVLELAEVLCAFRTTGPAARKALKEWFDAQADDDLRLKQFTTSVAGLTRGSCYVWSPGYLDLFEEVHIREALTFDSSATPARGKRLKPRGKAASLDLEDLGEKILATRERAQENDPRRLKAEVARLEGELARATARVEKVPVEVEVEKLVEVPMLTDEEKDLLTGLRGDLGEVTNRLIELQSSADDLATGFNMLDAQKVIEKALANAAHPPQTATVRKPPQFVIPDQATHPVDVRDLKPKPRAREESDDDNRFGSTEKKVLAVVRAHPKISTKEIALRAGYSAKASTTGVAISNLRKLGYMHPAENRDSVIDPIYIEPEYLPLPPNDLLEYWREKIDGTSRKVFDVLLDHLDDDLPTTTIAEMAGYSPGASTTGVALSKLGKSGLVTKRQITPEFLRAIGR